MKKLLKTLFVIAALGSGVAQSATYYVDGRAGMGSDAASGLIGQPWATLNKLLVKSPALTAGDTVILMCGSVWRESLTIGGAGGNSTSPITIRAETGCTDATRPEINGSTPITTAWTRVGVTSTYSTPLTATWVRQVFVNGRYLTIARYPATGFLVPIPGSAGTLAAGVATLTDTAGIGAMVAAAGASTVPTTTPVTDDNIAGGAAIYIRTVGWIVESATVSATGGITAGNTVLNMAPGSFQGVGQTALAYQPGTKPGGVNAAGYYLVNKLWMLSAAPGWYHDGTTLYVHLPDGTAPSSTSVGRVVEVSTTPRNYGIQLTNQPYVNISGIRVKQFGMDGIIVSSTESNSTLNQHTFNDMQVLNSGQNGITFANGAASPNGPTGTVSNSYINESVIDGVNLYYTNNVNVINNRIENSGVTGGPFRSRGAIWGMQSNNMVATGNSISRSGYIGIRFQGNATVKNNIIKDSCLVLDDCGGIYGWNNLNSIPLNSVISNNIIENVYGNRYGDPDSFTGATGIYLDDTASYVQVRGNTIINAGQGLYTHNGWKNVFDSNVIAYPRVVAMVSAFDYITLQSFYQQGNIFSNNTVLSGNHPNLQMYFHLGRLPSENITSGFPFPVQIMTANKYSGNSANTLMFVRSMVGTSGFSGTGSGSTGPETFATLVGKANHGTYRVMRKAAGLIVNKTAASVSYNCVASSSGITMWELKTTDCLNAKNFNGTKIKYPVTIPPYSSLPVFQ